MSDRTVIKIGDRVTWRTKHPAVEREVHGCKVLSLYDVNGKAVAEITWGKSNYRVGAYLHELTPEKPGKTTILSGG